MREMQKRLFWEWLCCLLVVLFTHGVMLKVDTVSRLSLAIYDAVQQANAIVPDRDILIVTIDDTSLKALGQWPWSRRHHAALLERLASARPRAVAMDILFSEAAPNAEDDDALAAALSLLTKVCPTVLPMTIASRLTASGEPEPVLPLPALEQAATALGHVHVALDADQVVRGLYLREGIGNQQWEALSLKVARLQGGGDRATDADASTTASAWQRQSLQLIAYPRGPGLYRSVPYISVLRGEVPIDVIRDRIVLVGITASGIGDRYPTPMAGGSLTPGIEIHAAALDGIKNGRMITPMKRSWSMLASFVALGVWMLCLRWLGPLGSLLGLGCFLALAITAAAVLQSWGRLWLPVGSWVISALLAYLLWSWRRLAILLANLYKRAELLLPANRPGRHGRVNGYDSVVAAFDQGLESARKVESQRTEALQMLSHDLRAPQAAILALLRTSAHSNTHEIAQLHSRIEQQVEATLGLAEDFAAQLRAEGGAYDWQEVDLTQLVAEVHDMAWPLAQGKMIGIQLEAEGPEGEADGCWALVEPRLLRRAIFNLVDNAIKYSPRGSRVQLRFVWNSARAVFSVVDEGEGISDDDLPRLFRRYGRGAGAGERVAGHGLGLWFVRTVAERHGGSVTCESTLGAGSTFTLSFPIRS